MVVCMVVRVQNLTRKTFYIIQGGDPFYADPRIADVPCVADTRFEVGPGLDAPAEGLVVPWTTTSRGGLVLGEMPPDRAEDREGCLRVVVGPHPVHSDGMDWLQLHTASWEPIAEEKWKPLGQRHLLGTIGAAVDLELIFQEDTDSAAAHIAMPASSMRSSSRSSASDHGTSSRPLSSSSSEDAAARRLSQLVRFDRQATCASRNTIFLNVYDLASATSLANQMLCNTLVKTFGAFHAAVEVYGEEWSFYRQQDPEARGVLRSRSPRNHSVHVYRQSIKCGETQLTDDEVWDVIVQELSPQWLGCRYDIIHCNCIHFCDELLHRLGAKPVPSWVKGLHETGAALARLTWPFSTLFGGSAQEENMEQASSTASKATADLYGSFLPAADAQFQGKDSRARAEPEVPPQPQDPVESEDMFSWLTSRLSLYPVYPPEQGPAAEDGQPAALQDKKEPQPPHAEGSQAERRTLEDRGAEKGSSRWHKEKQQTQQQWFSGHDSEPIAVGVATTPGRPAFLPVAMPSPRRQATPQQVQSSTWVSAFAVYGGASTAIGGTSPRSDGFLSADEEEPLLVQQLPSSSIIDGSSSNVFKHTTAPMAAAAAPAPAPMPPPPIPVQPPVFHGPI